MRRFAWGLLCGVVAGSALYAGWAMSMTLHGGLDFADDKERDMYMSAFDEHTAKLRNLRNEAAEQLGEAVVP